METNKAFGNGTQQAKVAEILASVPAGCTASQPIESGCWDVYLDITTPNGTAYRLAIGRDGKISKNRIMRMS